MQPARASPRSAAPFPFASTQVSPIPTIALPESDRRNSRDREASVLSVLMAKLSSAIA
jgi:hypothetical protein